MEGYTPTIGLEIHAELKTATKMFCRSKNDADETRPNINICPICLAHPGTLPLINQQAIKSVLLVGLSLGGKLADYTEFDRKNYFYPDLPKGYQLSQYEYPLVSGGALRGVAITRVHLEEDTASSVHEEGIGTLIDYNRAGVPLMELVTEPVMTSAEEAGDFARELQLLLRYLGASEANMEKGEMRIEANVRVRKSGSDTLGTKVEIKNLNSFRVMERAVAHEIQRQSGLLARGEAIVQETRGWDEKRQATFPQRTKEGSADYRYFPDPDLPSLRLSEIAEFSTDELTKKLPELPWQKRERYVSLGIKKEDAEMYVRDHALGTFFEAVIAGYPKELVQLASNYIANDLVSIVRARDPKAEDTAGEESGFGTDIPIPPTHFRSIIDMQNSRTISSRTAKDLLARAIKEGKDPAAIARDEHLTQSTDEGVLRKVAEGVMEAHAGVVADYRGGKTSAIEFLLGQCMKELRGAADPTVVRKLLIALLG